MQPQSYPRPNRQDNSKTEINAKEQDLDVVTLQVIDALVKVNVTKSPNSPIPNLVIYHDELCMVGSNEFGPAITKMNVDKLINQMAKHLNFWAVSSKDDDEKGPTRKKKKGSNARPPSDVARNILASPTLPFPIVDEIVSVPVFGKDGQLLDRPGYHESDRLIYWPSKGVEFLSVDSNPTTEYVERAKYLLFDDFLVDFPFASESDKCHALCVALHSFMKRMISGPTPFYLVEKPAPGAGGTLLVNVLTYLFLGKMPPPMTMPKDESEWRRTLHASLRSGTPILFIDNIDGCLDSPTLASMITSDSLTDRVIRTSSTQTVEVKCLFIGSGNNPRLSKELVRRSIRIRIDPKRENPELRQEFKHPDLKEYVRSQRVDLVWAILTLIQFWVAKGKPRGRKTLGSFEGWSWAMGGLLEAIGIPGFLVNREAFEGAATDIDEGMIEFLSNWNEKFGGGEVKAKDLIPFAGELNLNQRSGAGEESRSAALGKKLTRERDNMFGRYCIRVSGSQQNTKCYRLEVSND